jgi:hypothetical protein
VRSCQNGFYLVIGAVVSTEVQLTTTAGNLVWKLNYLGVTTGQFYSFTLSYTKPTVAATAAQAYITNSNSIAVVCVPTLSNFDVTVAGSPRSAFIFSSTNAGAAPATNDNIANWGPLVIGHAASGVYVTTTGSVSFTPGLAVTNCPLVTAAAVPVLANGIATYTFALAASCFNLPQMGTGWYAKCFAQTDLATAGSSQTGGANVVAATIVGAMDVTFAGTTTTCATTGASTFATGATILAGIAYLQF